MIAKTFVAVVASFLAVMSFANAASDELQHDQTAEDQLARYVRASPLRWGKRGGAVLRWGKRADEDLDDEESEAVLELVAQRQLREAPLRYPLMHDPITNRFN